MAVLLTCATAALVLAFAEPPWHGDQDRPLGVGDAAPRVLSDRAARFSVVWIFRGSDCLSCTAPTYLLRQAARQHPGVVDIVLLGVEADAQLVHGFLARERLPAETILISDDELRATFGGVSTPSVYLLEHGRIRAAWLGDLGGMERDAKDAPGLLTLISAGGAVRGGSPVSDNHEERKLP